MKMKNLRWVVLLFSLLFIGGVHAQNSFKINLNDGSSQEFNLEDLQTLKFDDEKMYVGLSENQNFSFQLEALRSFLFTDSGTDVPEVNAPADFELVAYPNPVNDKLNLKLPDIGLTSAKITLYNNQGQLVQQLDVNGRSEISVDVSRLTHGLYLCRYSSEGVVKTVKFIKH